MMEFNSKVKILLDKLGPKDYSVRGMPDPYNRQPAAPAPADTGANHPFDKTSAFSIAQQILDDNTELLYSNPDQARLNIETLWDTEEWTDYFRGLIKTELEIIRDDPESADSNTAQLVLAIIDSMGDPEAFA